MPDHDLSGGHGLDALLFRLGALDLRVDATERWQAKYEPIVDGLRDHQVIAQAIADAAADSLTNRWTKRHYAVAIAALFLPAMVSSAALILVHAWIG